MIITAYIDESGTHDGSPHTIMAGYVAPFGKWIKLEDRWDRMLKRHGVQYFHATEWLQGKKQFKGWTYEQKMQFILEAEKLIKSYVSFGITAKLGNADYEQHYVAGNRPRKPQLDTKYGICFRMILSVLPRMLDDIAKNPSDELHLILEDGHKNAGDAVRIFRMFKDEAPPDISRMVNKLSFADKKNTKPLQVADSLAYSAFRVEQTNHIPLIDFDINNGGLRQAKSFIQGKSPVLRVEGTAAVLSEMKESLLAKTAERQAFGGAREQKNEAKHPLCGEVSE